MMHIRRSEERGFVDHGWLQARHTFSFGSYYDRAHLSFGALRVINEDRVAPGTGFGEHGHRDMEIVTYILAGELAHRDSMGNGSVIRPGDVQRMSAGRGVRHSEVNPNSESTTHLLQIWIEPAQPGIDPGYEQRRVEDAAKRGRLALIASEDGRDGSVRIHQDARIHAGLFDGDERAELAIGDRRRVWVHVARGALQVNGERLVAGDAAALTREERLSLDAGEGAEVLAFDLP